jgi:putative flavoprotein involved in K+ transport
MHEVAAMTSDPNSEPVEPIDTVVVGGGQAGLAIGHHLARQGRPHVILEAADRIGSSWRNRWDGLRLFTPAKFDGLPGMPFPGPRHALPTKDEVAAYLETYAARFDLPVRTGVLVDEVAQDESGEGWSVRAGDQRWRASQVVLATGAYRTPRLPAFAGELRPEIRKLHASEYRNPSQLRDGPVLVVGASNSGAEIAMTTVRDHPTILSGRDTGTMPIRPDGLAARLFDPPFWLFINHIATAGTAIGRRARASIVDHGGPLERIWASDLATAGVERAIGRTVGTRDGWPVLDDGRVIEAANVIWCTGFRPDFDLVTPRITGPDGWPIHERGVVARVSGLFLVGMPFQHSAASSLLGGVGRDARFVADRIAQRSRRGQSVGQRLPRAYVDDSGGSAAPY